ncbi:hypothetical protein JW766_02390 [Candidatus Dojkabacteria bacterium]|nr:hypothetical protein [Candidatus Dojkabacteria bacterium]
MYLQILSDDLETKSLLVEGASCSLRLKTGELAQVVGEKVSILGKEITSKMKTKKQGMRDISLLSSFKEFIRNMRPQIVRLNHLGVSYSCNFIEKEVAYYKRIAENADVEIFEEDSGNKTSRWFFIGDKVKWESPLFEIVLSEFGKGYSDEWIPHFQIDIDTNLSFDELNKSATKYLDKNFLKWKFDIRDYGVVLGMGLLERIGGHKIYLGIGTNLRNTKYHREKLLKPVEGRMQKV